ncbi:MAG: hypothetical protein MZV49_22365 [Rhodopseudomonas palustris]|nr:hypothetical protein [Rhodopseudomonas palustris]
MLVGVLKPDFAVIRELLREDRSAGAGRRPHVRRLSLSRRAPDPGGHQGLSRLRRSRLSGREHPADLALLGDIFGGATLQGLRSPASRTALPAAEAGRLSRRAAAKLRHIETLRAEIMQDQQLSPPIPMSRC